HTNQKIACVTINGKRAYELKGKFLDDLRDYAFSGTNGEDAKRSDDQNGVIDDVFSDIEKVNNDEEHETDEEGYELFNDTTHNSRKMKSMLL
ncbi:hypothetical protein Tco_1330393, partial [Tanacetum coccineum]